MPNLEQSTTELNEKKTSSNELDSIMLEAALALQTPEALQEFSLFSTKILLHDYLPKTAKKIAETLATGYGDDALKTLTAIEITEELESTLNRARNLLLIAQTALETGYKSPDLEDKIYSGVNAVGTFLNRVYDHVYEIFDKDNKMALSKGGGVEHFLGSCTKIENEYTDLLDDIDSIEFWGMWDRCEIYKEFQKLSEKFQEKIRNAPVTDFTLEELRYIHQMLKPFLREDL